MITKRSSIILCCLMLGFSLLFIGSIASAQEIGGKQYQAGSKSVTPDFDPTDLNLLFMNYLADRQIISGYPDGGFHTMESMSRAQAAVVLVKAAALKTYSGNYSGFPDVNSDHWAAAYIAAGVRAGYLKGYPDGSYRPDAKLSRAEGISLILRLIKQRDTGVVLPPIEDMDSTNWAASSVATGLACRMVGLTDHNRFLPEEGFARGDMARAVAVLLTTDPELRESKLTGCLEVNKGKVKIDREGYPSQAISGGIAEIESGDVITSESGSEAQLSYPDGSSILLNEKTTLKVIDSWGQAYIKKNRGPGLGIGRIKLELRKGQIFGVLAPHSNQKIPLKEKEKVEIYMPWGVSTILGGSWSNTVTDISNKIYLLEGDAVLSAAGLSRSLESGQKSVITRVNNAPDLPTNINSEEANAWSMNGKWMSKAVMEIKNNQAALLAEASIAVPVDRVTTTAPAAAQTDFNPRSSSRINKAAAPSTAATKANITTDEVAEGKPSPISIPEIMGSNSGLINSVNPLGIPTDPMYNPYLLQGNVYTQTTSTGQLKTPWLMLISLAIILLIILGQKKRRRRLTSQILRIKHEDNRRK